MTVRPLSHLTFLLPSLRGGGAERVILDVAREAVREVAWVDLVLLESEGRYAALVPDGVQVVTLGAGRALTSIGRFRRYLRTARPDALVSAVPQANAAALLAAALAGLSTARVVSEHNIQTPSRITSRKGRLLLKLMHRVYPLADTFVAVSDPVARVLMTDFGRPAGQVAVVPNPVDTPMIHRRMTEAPAHPWLADKTTPVLACAARLVADKDLGTLIRALAAMTRFPDTRLVILGEGPLRDSLLEQARALGVADRVDLPGFSDNPFAEIARSDAFVLSSRFEGFGNVVIEALACGTPVVATRNTGGIADRIEDGQAVRCVPIGDATAMADAIEETLATGKPSHASEIAEAFLPVHAWTGYRAAIAQAMARRADASGR